MRLNPSVTLRRDARVEPVVGGAGRLKHIILDPETHEVTDLVAAFDGKEWLVPIAAVASAAPDRIVLRHGWSEYQARGPFVHDGYRSLDPQEARSGRSRVAGRGGAPLLDADRESVQIPQLVVPEEEQSVTAERSRRIALREERLRVEQKNKPAALLRVRRRTVERVQMVEVTVREELAVLEVVGSSADDAVMIGDRALRPGETLELTLATERIQVSKERVPIEDVMVRKETLQREERVQETLRKEELVIEDPGRLAIHTPAPIVDSRDGGGRNGNRRASTKARGAVPAVEERV
jgi:uncharacterized protein (TIGR02271 family)